TQARPAAPERVAAAAAATPAGKPDPAPEATPRYVVQVGAYADAGAVRAVRGRVEQLGLRSYTQVVKVDAGERTRVRIGPFDDRTEADKVAGRLKAAGLPSAVLRL
ncbi:MAG: SPOR domain-containing protein, partial [Burkholderiales bacterium]|nr:SPOR domain-containing protein [Burkholderiales bacterium]